jgi:hypothetical protein
VKTPFLKKYGVLKNDKDIGSQFFQFIGGIFFHHPGDRYESDFSCDTGSETQEGCQ